MSWGKDMLCCDGRVLVSRVVESQTLQSQTLPRSSKIPHTVDGCQDIPRRLTGCPEIDSWIVLQKVFV